MTLVTLEDGTTYYIDTNSEFNAEQVVEHKLRDHMDYREIDDIEVLDELRLDNSSKYYNSGDAYDGVPLQCKTGWSYKWSDGKSASFR